MPKRRMSDKKIHLLDKIKKLESEITNLTDSDEEEEKEEVREENIEEKATESLADKSEEDLYEVFIEEEENESNEHTLDDEVLDILGVAPNPTPKKEVLHKDLVDRWSEILTKGLKKDEKETISKDNLPFENLPKMIVPKLNKEVAVALNENARKRDQIIENRQRLISTALVCVGQALQASLGSNIQDQKLKIIKKMNEAGRLLCNSLHEDAKGRRALILKVVNRDMKESLSETEVGEFLFGENLSDKIKTAKAIQKSAKDLTKENNPKKENLTKSSRTTDKRQGQSLNWRAPPRFGRQKPQRASGGATTFNHFNRQPRKNEEKTKKK